MLITNEHTPVTWNLSDNGSGDNWFFAAPLDQLTNGQPRVGVRLVRSTGTTNFYLEAEFASNSLPRVFSMLGLGEEWEGQSVALFGRDPVSGNYSVTIENAAQISRFPDGSLGVLVFIDTSALGSGISGIRIIGLGSAGAYTIGEVVIATAQEWCIRRDWAETVVSLSKELRSITGQPTAVRRVQQRKASVTIAPQPWTKSFSAGSPVTLQKLQARLSQYQPVLVIPALRQPGLGVGASIDMDTVLATMLFGTCSNLGQISLVSESNLSQLKLEFTEAPAGRIG